MSKFNLLLLPLSLILFSGCSSSNTNSVSKTSKPNIIFIMSDDQGYADLGSYGSEYVKTPYLDQMAKEGMRFTQAYVGSPVCAPTRCSLLTGKHSGHITRRGNRAAHQDLPFMERMLIPLRDEDFTLGELMKTAGYTTGCIGKWGLGNPGTTGTPDKQGFDYFFGYVDQVHAHNYYTDYLIRNTDTIEIPENRNGQKQVYSHDLIAEETLDFIRRNQKDPFFLYLPLTLPHGKYEIPDNSLYEDYDWPERVKNYAAMISLMDKDIGRIFDLLKELKLDKNTIVFFTSDNGPNPPFIKPLESNKPFRGLKRELLEGGIRVPMIARWPQKIEAGKVSDFTWAFWDVMPTLADLAGIDKSKETDGISVLPTLLGKQQDPKEHLYWEFYDPFQQAVRMKNWKGIRLGTEESIHLFDLSSDLKEEKNVASEYPDIVAKISQIMEESHEDSPYWPTKAHTTDKIAKRIFGE